MKEIVVTFGVVVIYAALYLDMTGTNAQVPEKSCKSVLGDLTKRQLNGISSCGKTMKFKNGKDKSKKMNCILRCVMTNEKLLSPEGLFTKESADELILREFPPSLIDKVNASFTSCIDKASIINPNLEEDEYCKTYDPFIKCLFGMLPNLCA